MILTAILIILSCFSLLYWRHSLVSPSLLFCTGFVIAVIFCSAFADSWGYQMSVNCAMVISVGSIIFVVAAMITDPFIDAIIRRRKPQSTTASLKDVQQASYLVLILLAFFQLLMVVLTLKALLDMSGTNSLTDAILSYRYDATYSPTGALLPTPIRQLRYLCIFGMPYLTYLMSAAILQRKNLKYILLLAVNIIISFALNIIVGSRTTGVELIICGLITFLLLKQSFGTKRFNLQLFLRQGAAITIVVIILLLSFQSFAIGRSGTSSIGTYLGVYIGAPVHNLDCFIRDRMGQTNPPIWGYMTFIRTINYIGQHVGIDSLVYPLDLPYLRANGIETGNVYTIYYAFLYDFGIWGVPALVAVMSAASQILYKLALRKETSILQRVFVISYSYASFQIFSSFFSNKFYESVLSVNMLRRTAYLVLFIIFFETLNRLIRKTKIKQANTHQKWFPALRDTGEMDAYGEREAQLPL